MPEQNYSPPNEAPPCRIDRVLVGQKALVTGASKGLGQAMAIGFARAGADVLVNYNSDEAGAIETKRRIEEHGGKAVLCKADVSKEREVRTMFGSMIDSFGRIDICAPNSAPPPSTRAVTAPNASADPTRSASPSPSNSTAA